jgi:hypothetical protein
MPPKINPLINTGNLGGNLNGSLGGKLGGPLVGPLGEGIKKSNNDKEIVPPIPVIKK